MKTPSPLTTLLLAVSLPLFAWPGAAQAAPADAVAVWGAFDPTTVPVAAQSGVTAIAAGAEHTVALKNDGSVVAWGSNYRGQTTVPVAAQNGVTAIAAGGSHTVALKNDGSVAAWGLNDSGQTTVPVAAQSGVTAITAGTFHTVALKNDGSVLSWGHYHYSDESGSEDYDFGQTTVPTAAKSGVIAIAAGTLHTVALKNNGSVVAWGSNFHGQTKVPVAARSGVIAIAAGHYHTVALKSNGSVVAWGFNDSGQTTVPVAAQSGVIAISAGWGHTVALKSNGSVVAWGLGDSGQTTVPAGLSGVTAIAAGGFHTVALYIPTAPAITTQPMSQTVNAGQIASFTVVATGYLLSYQWQKDGTNISGATGATYSLGEVRFSAAGSYTVVVTNHLGSVTSTPPAVLTVNAIPPGTVMVAAWGNNGSGQTTVPPAARSGVTAIAGGGSHTVALKNDGSVVAWGYNYHGQTTVPVAAQSGVIAIAAGTYHTVALKNNGSVVAWGDNYYGQTTVPVTAQSGVTAIAAGAHHTVALKSNGSVVVWGNNDYGQTTVPVAAQSGVIAIAAGSSHTVALKNNGSVVAWGNNGSGQTTVPVAAQSGVIAIAAGTYHTVALKSDGSVLSWGHYSYYQEYYDDFGLSGYNSADYDYGQPAVPVAAQSGVTAIAAGPYHTVALKSDGSVLAWRPNGISYYSDRGYNRSYYEGDYGQATVPAGLTEVTAIAAGGFQTVVLDIPTAPAITTPPMSQTVNAGQIASFTVAATGLYLNYQWRKDGINISGATSPTYRLENVWFSDAGSYTVVVENYSGSVTSTPPAVLTVTANVPIISTPPMSQTVTAGQGASFTVTATGYPLTYQWRKDGTNINGATGTTYRVDYAWFSDAGSYTVLVSNPVGSVTSTPSAVLTVNAPLPNSVLAWGSNDNGQTTVPVAAQSGVTAIAAGESHTVGLKNDGSVVAWGYNGYGQTTVPVAAQSGVTAIASGTHHAVALKNDGSVVGWGAYDQTTVPVAAQSGVTAIAAGWGHTVALKNDGGVVAWGWNDSGQTTVPVAANSGVTAIAAGAYHTVALKNDGSVLSWGYYNDGYVSYDFGQTTVPVAAQSGVIAIAAGRYHTVALKNDGSVLAWGGNYYDEYGTIYDSGQTTVPMAAQSGVIAIAAGGAHTVALFGTAMQPSFAGWAAGFGLAGAFASADADPDHDGLASGLEFILGGNPAQPFPATPRPVASLNGGNLLFTFPRLDASETSDTALTVESGTDLVTWPDVFTIGANTAASSPGATIIENGTAPDTITVAIPAGSGNARFARLRATIGP